MLYETLEAIRAVVEDTDEGVNAQIVELATARSISVPPMSEVLIWENKLPSEMLMPTMQVVYSMTPEITLRSQEKWRLGHHFEFQFWQDMLSVPEGKLAQAMYLHAGIRLLDRLEGTGAVEIVEGVRADAFGWRAPGGVKTCMAISFTARERHESP